MQQTGTKPSFLISVSIRAPLPPPLSLFALQVRFDFFCKAALEFLLKTGRQPDILHCHDWSTAHVAKAFWEDYQPYGLYNPKVGWVWV